MVHGRVFLLTILQTPPQGEGTLYRPSGNALGSFMDEAMETVTDKLDHIMLYRVHLELEGFEPNVSGNRYCCKSNYYTITTNRHCTTTKVLISVSNNYNTFSLFSTFT